MTKRTFIVGAMAIMHNGQRLPPGSDIELTFEEYRSLGLDLEESRGTEIVGTVEAAVPLPELHLHPLAEDPLATAAALGASAQALAAEALPVTLPVPPDIPKGDDASINCDTESDATAASKPGRTKKGA